MKFEWKPGSNCWKTETASRLSILIDAEAYFRAVFEALIQARSSVFILGWDIHSEVHLVRGETAEEVAEKWPTRLGPLLNALVKQRPDLDVYLLNWDFAMIYALEREFFPSYKLDWKSHDRVHFCLDGEHPTGASQHQKIVVVDDEIAFVGGIDLSKWRWDTREHRPDHELRRSPEGKPYPPFHDVQMLVEGPAARAVSRLARNRWQVATCKAPIEKNPQPAGSQPWPASASVMATGVTVAIARTLPAFRDQKGVREVEQLYIDSIEAARRFIYLENQYFSSETVGKALARRLEEENGPEVVLVMPERTGGWLEQHTMDVLRSRLMRLLQDADKHGRLRIYGVRLTDSPPLWLMVHAKVCVIDDRFLRIGSANLSNRSMGLDSECDLALYVEDDSGRFESDALPARFRRDLLSEHLGVSEEALLGAEKDHDSLIEAIESLREGARTLVPLSPDIPETVDRFVPEAEVIDPEKPLEPDEFLERIVRPEKARSVLQRYGRIFALIGGILALALAWRFTGLSEWLSVDRAEELANRIQDAPFTPLLVMLAYVIGGLIALPITLMIVATVTVFGTWTGMAYALAGAELSAVVTYGVGHLLGRDKVGRIAGSRINRLIQALAKRGIVTVMMLRIVPVAPFTVINVAAGVSPIRFRDFALGSFLGIIPGVLGIGLMADQILASLKNPDPKTLTIAAVVIAVVIGVLYGLRVWVERRRGKSS